MKPTDEKALDQLERLASGHAVAYRDLPPFPIVAAGLSDGRAWYALDEDGVHPIPNEWDARLVGEIGIGYYDGERLALYITRADEAPEIDTSHAISVIDAVRERLGDEGMEALRASAVWR